MWRNEFSWWCSYCWTRIDIKTAASKEQFEKFVAECPCCGAPMRVAAEGRSASMREVMRPAAFQ